VNHLDGDTGSIAIGKLADLTVIDRDLFARGGGLVGGGPDAAAFIGEARVIATIVGGEGVYEAPELG
jgi:predicted amidohydrolase YtcJ